MTQPETIEVELVLQALSSMSLEEVAGLQLAVNTAWQHEMPRVTKYFKRIIFGADWTICVM